MGADTRFGSTRWARLAVALVNTAPSRRHEDLLTRPDQLCALLLEHDEPGLVEVDERDLADARAARQALAGIFAARDDRDQVAARLNELLARTARPRLTGHGGIPLHLHVDAPDSTWGSWLAAIGAMALALLIAEHGIEVLAQCEADGCAHAVLRTGPGPARRYCDNACASRSRVAAYRANRKAARLRRGRSCGSTPSLVRLDALTRAVMPRPLARLPRARSRGLAATHAAPRPLARPRGR